VPHIKTKKADRQVVENRANLAGLPLLTNLFFAGGGKEQIGKCRWVSIGGKNENM